jgi:hypothetical protein
MERSEARVRERMGDNGMREREGREWEMIESEIRVEG